MPDSHGQADALTPSFSRCLCNSLSITVPDGNPWKKMLTMARNRIPFSRCVSSTSRYQGRSSAPRSSSSPGPDVLHDLTKFLRPDCACDLPYAGLG